MHTIEILGFGDAGSAIRKTELPKGAEFKTPQQPDGMHLLLESILLAVLSKEVLAAAIGAVGTVWAAKIAAKAAGSDKKAAAVPAIEIVTIGDRHMITVDGGFEQRVQASLPDNIRAVMSVRLVALAPDEFSADG